MQQLLARVSPLIVAIGCAALLACADAAHGSADSVAAAPWRASGDVIDSARPPEEDLRRFRATVADTPTTLVNAGASREALVRRFMRALAQSDSVALRDMSISPGEFAWLYYPSSPFAAPPYELPAGLAWFQVRGNSDAGRRRLLSRLGGQPMRYLGHSCDSVRTEGDNRVHSACSVVTRAGEDTTRRVLFGSIVERGGRFKFLGLSNRL